MHQPTTDLLDELLSPQLSWLFQKPLLLDKPSGWWGHVPFAFWLVAAARPRLLVELGTHHGVSYTAFCEAVRLNGLDCRCFAIDNWQGDAHAGYFGDEVYHDLKDFNRNRYSGFSELIRSDFADALEHFADGSIDLLHIDGFHTYEAVQRDYQQWRTKLSDSAVVLFHDTNVRRDDFGVHRLFAELARDYPHFEFLHSNGLGLIAYGSQVAEPVHHLCNLGKGTECATARERFSHAGVRWECQANEQEMARSFALQVAALEAERVKAGEERAGAEATATQWQQQFAQAENNHLQQITRLENELKQHHDRLAEAEMLRLDEHERANGLAIELDRNRTGNAQHVSALKAEQSALEEQCLRAETLVVDFQNTLEGTRRDLSYEREQRLEERRVRSLLEQEVGQLRQQVQSLQEICTQHATLAKALSEAEARSDNAHLMLTRNQAEAERQTRRLAQDLLARLPISRPPGFFRRLSLMLRRGHARRNPYADVVRRSPLFDENWYVRTYPDIEYSGIDPAFHYLAHGGHEGRDPGPWFSTREYLQYNPDVARNNVNALLHYELHGRLENRGVPVPRLTVARTDEHNGSMDLKSAFRRQSLMLLESFLNGDQFLELPTSESPVLSIVIVTHNQAELSFRCLKSLTEVLDTPAEVLVVDNASTDHTAELLARTRGCRVLQQTENLHFLQAANLGAAQARGQVLLFLNNDTLVRPGAISSALRTLEQRPEAGAVGCRIILLDGSLQEAGNIVWSDGSCQGYGRGSDPDAAEFQFRREVDYCSGAFLMVPRPLFEQLGGFDPRFAPAYYEEVDLCIRLRQAGHPVIYEPSAAITHFEFGSAPDNQSAIQLMQSHQQIFRELHAHTLQDHCPVGSSPLQARTVQTSRRKILLVDDQIPVPSWGSGYPRAHEVVATLHRLGALVTYYPMVPAEIDFDDAYGVLPREVEIAAPQGPAGLIDFLRSRRDHYDMLMISRPHNMQILFNALEQEPGLLGRTRLVYDAEAIFARREQLKAQVLGHAGHNADLDGELRLAKPAQTILAVSQSEGEHFIRAGYTDVRILSHSIEVQPTPAGHAERQDLLFVGRLEEDDSPNADSIRWFVHEVMPRLDRLLKGDYCLNIVGACSAKLRRDLESRRVRFHGRIADISHFYASARLFIAPTRFAAGIPLKIYEAAAHGLPTVASRLLVDQLTWSDGSELLAADSADDFAQACAQLYREETLWTRLRQQALRRTAQDCSAQGFASTLQQLIDETLPPGDTARQNDASKISELWGQPTALRIAEHGMNWMEHPHVQARLNCKISGDPHLESYLHLRQVLQQQGWQFPVKRAASLGCGFGPLERALALENIAERIDGYDLAVGAIAEARRLAAESNLYGLHYHVADLERLQLPEAQFDLIFAYSCIHHVDDLEGLFRQVKRALRPGGVFFLHEYVGPDRFQWTDTQLEHINAFIADLPPGYNRLPDGRERGKVRRPSAEEVIARDPSEAIRSSQIAETLQSHFGSLQRYELGGALLHIGLSGIAQNFSVDNPTDIALLESFFALEDQLMAEGRISSDFTVFSAMKA